MMIALWIPEDPQAVSDAENGKRKGEIEKSDKRFVANVISGRFRRIARNWSLLMADDHSRISIGAEALVERSKTKFKLFRIIM
jgi:hypothetical protein